MKLRTLILCGSVAVVAGAGASTAWAHYEFAAGISINAAGDFSEPLGAYGTWVELGSYGRCWRPASVAADWRPYCDGYWAWTDCGWYWVSEEPWAWACYHYGRWAYDDSQGWVWVPGVEWAPCWVEWRTGGGYCGWAPLPPACAFRAGAVLTGEGVAIAPSAFVFVDERHFGDPIRRSTVIVNNKTILNKTVNVTRIKEVNHSLFVNGPDVATIQRATGRSVRRADAAAMWQEHTQRAVTETSAKHVAPPPVSKTWSHSPAEHTTQPAPTESGRQPERAIGGEPGRATPVPAPSRSVEPKPVAPREEKNMREPVKPAPAEQPAPEQRPRSHSWWPFGQRSQPRQPAPETRPSPPPPASEQPSQNRGYYYRRAPAEPSREQPAPRPERQYVPPNQPAPHPVGPGGGGGGGGGGGAEKPSQGGHEEKQNKERSRESGN